MMLVMMTVASLARWKKSQEGNFLENDDDVPRLWEQDKNMAQ